VRLIYRHTGTEFSVSPFVVNVHMHTLARPPNCVLVSTVPRISEFVAEYRMIGGEYEPDRGG
jgi:hypothetical protein